MTDSPKRAAIGGSFTLAELEAKSIELHEKEQETAANEIAASEQADAAAQMAPQQQAEQGSADHALVLDQEHDE